MKIMIHGLVESDCLTGTKPRVRLATPAVVNSCFLCCGLFCSVSHPANRWLFPFFVLAKYELLIVGNHYFVIKTKEPITGHLVMLISLLHVGVSFVCFTGKTFGLYSYTVPSIRIQ
jgi:hypothetical protein